VTGIKVYVNYPPVINNSIENVVTHKCIYICKFCKILVHYGVDRLKDTAKIYESNFCGELDVFVLP
jgi:hypothetical protein